MSTNQLYNLKKALEQCLFYFAFSQYAIGLWPIILCITSDDQLMKKLNDIACNLNINPTKFRRDKCCVEFNSILIEFGLIESNLIQFKF